MSWLLWIMLWWTWKNRCLSDILTSFPLDVYPVVIVGSYGSSIPVLFWGESPSVSITAVLIYITTDSSALYKGKFYKNIAPWSWVMDNSLSLNWINLFIFYTCLLPSLKWLFLQPWQRTRDDHSWWGASLGQSHCSFWLQSPIQWEQGDPRAETKPLQDLSVHSKAQFCILTLHLQLQELEQVMQPLWATVSSLIMWYLRRLEWEPRE
jgi:hypothetical protein